MTIRVIYTNDRFEALLGFYGLPVPETRNPVPDCVASHVTDSRLLLDLDGDQILVSLDLDDASIWVSAVALQVDHVVVLPDGHDWLQERIDAAVLVEQCALYLASV